jgi:hypothetical protein
MPGDKPRKKATSVAQQRVAGMAHAIQKGEMKAQPGTPSAEMAKSMGKADVKAMASTTHGDKPMHVKQTPTGKFSKHKL